jgi:hypothetical protein
MQAMESQTPLYAVPLSSLIDEEIGLSRKKFFTRKIQEGITDMLAKAVSLANWDYNKDVDFGIDDMFPLVKKWNDYGLSEVVKVYTYEKKRHKIMPLRLIPVFNLPFIYCQLNIANAYETMSVTVQNIDELYRMKLTKIMKDREDTASIACIRLMKLQMVKNFNRVANLFVTPIERLINMEQKVIIDKDLGKEKKRAYREKKHLTFQIEKWKKKYEKERKQNETLKRRIEMMEYDQRNSKLGPKLEESNE